MLMLDRRMLLGAGSAAVGAAALAPTTPGLAHAPQAGKRAQPGFYRFKLGSIEITVAARIDLRRNETGGFVLAAALAVTMAGIDQQTAERLVQGAHTICPYSNAIRTNIDVAISVSVR